MKYRSRSRRRRFGMVIYTCFNNNIINFQKIKDINDDININNNKYDVSACSDKYSLKI